MKIICVGRNYVDHAAELKNEIPSDPVIFLKPESACHHLSRPYKIPEFTLDLHHELELILRIGKSGKNIQKINAWSHINGISVGIDFTARDLQSTLKSKGLPWELSKAFDGSAIVGEFYHPVEFNLQNIRFHLLKNNIKVQEGQTKDMLFDIPTLISFISRYFTLNEGDILFTGTPSGVSRVNTDDKLQAFLENRCIFTLIVH